MVLEIASNGREVELYRHAGGFQDIFRSDTTELQDLRCMDSASREDDLLVRLELIHFPSGPVNGFNTLRRKASVEQDLGHSVLSQHLQIATVRHRVIVCIERG